MVFKCLFSHSLCTNMKSLVTPNFFFLNRWHRIEFFFSFLFSFHSRIKEGTWLFFALSLSVCWNHSGSKSVNSDIVLLLRFPQDEVNVWSYWKWGVSMEWWLLTMRLFWRQQLPLLILIQLLEPGRTSQQIYGLSSFTFLVLFIYNF